MRWGEIGSEATIGAPRSSQGRAIIHRSPGTDASEYSREHEREGQVVEYLSAGRAGGRGHFPSLVVEEVFRGE